MWKISKLQISRSMRLFIQITSELVRSKARDSYFAFLYFTSTYVHFASIYEHLFPCSNWDLKDFVFFDTKSSSACKS